MVLPFQWLRQWLNSGWLAGREAQWTSLAKFSRGVFKEPLRKAAADFSSSLPRNFDANER